MKALIDICVILDVFFKRKEFFEDSKRVLDYIAQEKIIGFITSCSLGDIYYICHRDNHSDEKSKIIVHTLLNLVNVLDVNKSDIINAIQGESNDFEDAVLIESAKRNGISTIITRNISDFKNTKLNILTPSQIK